MLFFSSDICNRLHFLLTFFDALQAYRDKECQTVKRKKKNKKKVQCNLNKYTFLQLLFFSIHSKKIIWKVYLSESLVVSFQVIKTWMLLWNSSVFKAALNKLTLLTILTIWPLTFVHMSFIEIAVNANSFKLINHIQLFNYFDKNSELCFPSLNSSRLMHSSMSRYMPCLITKLLCGSCSSVNDYFVVVCFYSVTLPEIKISD